jgi:LDH2 family malate/lactate/ureidoglycolate dehydrogenase
MLRKALATVAVKPADARPTAGRRCTTPVVRASASAGSMNNGAARPAGTTSKHVNFRQLRGNNALASANHSASGRRANNTTTTTTVTPSALFGNSNKASAPEPSEVSVPIAELIETTRRGIKTYGYGDAETQILLDVMMYAQLRGNNQGIIKVTTKAIARDPTATPVTTQHETMLSACFDGGKNAGMVVLHKAMETAVSKAEEHGFGICGTNNTCTSTGALGYYAENVAKRGLIALVFAQSPEFVAPNGAMEPIFGTNPLGDGKGNVTEDPNAAIEGGAIKTFDGSYKSSNLALIVELLAGPLVGAAIADKMSEKNWGNLVIAVDPKLLGQGEFEKRAAAVTERVKGAKKMPGVTEILLPGERGDAFAEKVKADGCINVEANLWRGLQELAAEYTPPAAATGASSSGRTPYSPPAGGKRAPGGPNGWGVATRLVHPEATIEDPFMATAPPLYQTATFAQPSATSNGPYDYTRSGNPTRDLLEMQMAELEGATRGFAFSSGMSALMTVTRLVRTGERIVTGEDIYGGTSRLLGQVVPKVGIEVVNVDMNDLAAVKRAIDGWVALTPGCQIGYMGHHTGCHQSVF